MIFFWLVGLTPFSYLNHATSTDRVCAHTSEKLYQIRGKGVRVLLVMLDAFSFATKAFSVMKASWMRWAWLLPRVAHVQKAGMGVAFIHTIRVINTWPEFEAGHHLERYQEKYLDLRATEP